MAEPDPIPPLSSGTDDPPGVPVEGETSAEPIGQPLEPMPPSSEQPFPPQPSAEVPSTLAAPPAKEPRVVVDGIARGDPNRPGLAPWKQATVAVAAGALSVILAHLDVVPLGIPRLSAIAGLQAIQYSWFLVLAIGVARRRKGWERRVWQLFAFSSAAAVLSPLVYLASQATPGSVAAPLPAAASLVAVEDALAFFALLLIARHQSPQRNALLLVLDAAIVAGAFLLLLWVLVYNAAVAEPAAPSARLLVIAFPAVDAAILTVAGLAVLNWQPGRPPGYAYLMWGWFAIVVTDAITAYMTLYRVEGGLVIGGDGSAIGVTLLLLGAAAVRFGRPWPDIPARAPGLALRLFPLIPFSFAIAAVWFGPDAWGATAASAVLAALVVLRLVVTVISNQWLENQLARALDRRTHLLRMVSHEIANPLQPLTLHMAVLRNSLGELTPRQERSIGAIERSTDRLVSLSQEVRELALVDAGRLVRAFADCDAAALVRQAVDTAEPQASAKGIRLEARLPDGPLQARLDPGRFGQVLDNLLSNALKFTPSGGTVTVTIAAKDGNLRVEVRDTGAGLSPAQAKALFGEFSRVHSGTAPGLGLGLYLCQGIVKAHGGTIKAESEGADKGATFIVTLPTAGPAAAGTSATNPASTSSSPSSNPAKTA